MIKINGYKLESQTPETMKLFGRANKLIAKKKTKKTNKIYEI